MGDTDASGKDFLLDAVAQFLQSGVWLDAVSAFLEGNFRLFLADEGAKCNVRAEGKVAEYSLGQYEAFTAFKDLVERLLEQLMADLGCSGEDLVAALEDSVRKEQSLAGERRFFIKTLLSFDDYDAFCDKMTQFAAEKRANGLAEDSGGASVELLEWKLQEVIARSILDAKALGQLDEVEQAWVPWAEAMVKMTEQVPSPSDEDTVTGDGDASDDSKNSDSKANELKTQEDDDGLRGLQQTLIRERLKVDLLVAQRIADGNASLKRQMLHLAAQEADQEQLTAPGTDEDELAEQFKQVEGIRDRLKEVKTQCFAFKDIQQEQMDTIYLYLKEKVHYKQDLVAQEKDIATFIFTHVQEKDAALVPLMLEWLLLESELQRTQNYIQEFLNGPQDTGYWTQQWDEASQALYYINSVSGESVWEAPQCGYYDLNQEFQWEPASSDQEAGSESQSQDPSSVESTDASADQPPPRSFEEVAQQLEATPSSTSEAATGELLEMESVLERISREHDEERKRLELVFELEKARQKEELRKRKEKKRREKIAKKKKRDAARDVKEDGVDGNGSEIVSEVMPDPGVASDTKLEEDISLQQPPAPLLTSRLLSKANAKDERSDLSILIPGHGRVDLSHLLSDNHAKRHHKRKGTTPDSQTAHMMLHPTSLRYLTEQMVKRQEDVGEAPRSARKELVLEELADEK